MSLLLIRHGETALNVARTLQPPDTPLGDRGRQQAEAVAMRLANGAPKVAAIVSSDLARALQTAQAIARATGAPLELSALWQERNFGAWRGQRYDTFDVDPLTMYEAPPNGESMAAFEQRVAAAFVEALERHAALVAAPDTALAVVTHGLVIRALLERHVRLPDGTSLPTHLSNTGISLIDAAAPHHARLVDCTRHLAEVTGDDRRALSGG